MKLDLIFAHVPKTGGTALRGVLEENFGGLLVIDDGDRLGNPASPMNIDPSGFLRRCEASGYSYLDNKKAVMGHFWIKKYEPVAAHLKATVLREPIARALSHYYFWRSLKLDDNPVRRYVIEYQLSFLEFCTLPFIRGYYSRHYFRDVDMQELHIIIDYEEIIGDWHGTLNKLGLRAPSRWVNETMGDEYKRNKLEILQNRSLMGEIRSLLADDIDFYERWAS